jgi:hypothetical protein
MIDIEILTAVLKELGYFDYPDDDGEEHLTDTSASDTGEKEQDDEYKQA